MSAQKTYDQLKEFWRSAYSSLSDSPQDIELTLTQWISNIFTTDGLELNSSFRTLFSAKPPEPYFGKWVTDDGELAVQGKTIVALINPGDGITFRHCEDPDISLVGRPHWRLLKEYYTTGAVTHDGAPHHLLYSRKLLNPTFNYRSGTRHFAWGWWNGQWKNMLHAISEDDEDEAFLTLELIAYSSPNANGLNSEVVNKLTSSRLVVQLICDLMQQETAKPKRIILVNKKSIWEPIFQQKGFRFMALGPLNRGGKPKAYQVFSNEKTTPVPVILLHQAQKMKFPTVESGANDIFV